MDITNLKDGETTKVKNALRKGHNQSDEQSGGSCHAIKAQLLIIKGLIRSMEDQAKIQKNVSKVIKDGLIEIGNATEAAMTECESLDKRDGSPAAPQKVQNEKSECIAGGSQSSPSQQQQRERNERTTVREKRGNQEPSVEPRHAATSREPTASAPRPASNTRQVKERENGWVTNTQERRKKMRKEKKLQKAAQESDRKQPLPRSTRSAVLVKPGVGQTYAEVLQKLKSNVSLTETKVEVKGVQKTKEGALLIRLGKGAENRQNFKAAVAEVLGEEGQIRDLTQKVTLEVLDLDCTTSKTEVKEAILSQAPRVKEVKVHVLEPNKHDQRMALCELDAQDAAELLKIGKLRVGWVRCRIRQRLKVTRCHRCHGYGHLKRDCKGPDLTNACWKCGNSGHKARDCTNRPKCFLCARHQGRETKHTPGSGACEEFRTALKAAKEKTKK